MLERIVDRCKALRIGHGLKVVEHNDQFRLEGSERVRQFVDGAFDRSPHHAEALQRTASESLPDPIDGGGDVRPQPNGIVVTGIEGDPGQRSLAAVTPCTHCGRLAVARLSRDEGQRGVISVIQGAPDTRPVDYVAAHAWNRELRFDQQRRLVPAGQVELGEAISDPEHS